MASTGRGYQWGTRGAVCARRDRRPWRARIGPRIVHLGGRSAKRGRMHFRKEVELGLSFHIRQVPSSPDNRCAARSRTTSRSTPCILMSRGRRIKVAPFRVPLQLRQPPLDARTPLRRAAYSTHSRHGTGTRSRPARARLKRTIRGCALFHFYICLCRVHSACLSSPPAQPPPTAPRSCSAQTCTTRPFPFSLTDRRALDRPVFVIRRNTGTVDRYSPPQLITRHAHRHPLCPIGRRGRRTRGGA